MHLFCCCCIFCYCWFWFFFIHLFLQLLYCCLVNSMPRRKKNIEQQSSKKNSIKLQFFRNVWNKQTNKHIHGCVAKTSFSHHAPIFGCMRAYVIFAFKQILSFEILRKDIVFLFHALFHSSWCSNDGFLSWVHRRSTGNKCDHVSGEHFCIYSLS